MKLVYIGDHFYPESGSIMSSIYTEDGRRSDWGQVQMALKRGESIEIRQSTLNERKPYEEELTQIKENARKMENYHD